MNHKAEPSELEQRLVEAFQAASNETIEHPDLFERVRRTIVEDEIRRVWRKRMIVKGLAFVSAGSSLTLLLTDKRNGRITMSWWLIELLTTAILITIAIFLGPFIKRFGRAYAADVFRANPRTGKSYLILTDIAYYLIFSAFILFTVNFEQFDSWKLSTGNQLKHEVARVAGILLIMGFMHAANVVALPLIGRMLTWNANSESVTQQAFEAPSNTASLLTPGGIPLSPGTWTVRIERIGSPNDNDT